jgi:hypothetical protein
MFAKLEQPVKPGEILLRQKIAATNRRPPHGKLMSGLTLFALGQHPA